MSILWTLDVLILGIFKQKNLPNLLKQLILSQ